MRLSDCRARCTSSSFSRQASVPGSSSSLRRACDRLICELRHILSMTASTTFALFPNNADEPAVSTPLVHSQIGNHRQRWRPTTPELSDWFRDPLYLLKTRWTMAGRDGSVAGGGGQAVEGFCNPKER
jgi:hypothetical protein